MLEVLVAKRISSCSQGLDSRGCVDDDDNRFESLLLSEPIFDPGLVN